MHWASKGVFRLYHVSCYFFLLLEAGARIGVYTLLPILATTTLLLYLWCPPSLSLPPLRQSLWRGRVLIITDSKTVMESVMTYFQKPCFLFYYLFILNKPSFLKQRNGHCLLYPLHLLLPWAKWEGLYVPMTLIVMLVGLSGELAQAGQVKG